MKITTKTYDAKRRQQFRYAHIKRDGIYCNVIRSSGDGKLSIWTSRPNDITESLQFLTGLIATAEAMPLGVSLLGELWLPGHPSSEVKSAIANQNANLVYSVFAIRGYPNFNPDRLAALPLHDCGRLAGEMGFAFLPWVENPKLPLSLDNLPPDVEGYVLKNGNLLDWTRLKPRTTIDLIVNGTEPGKGKYANLIGSLICKTAEGYEVANVSGMTDSQRRFFSEHGDKILGKVVEVEYQGIGAQGRLRHPSFVRVRDDKAACDCTTEQDDDLRAAWSTPLFPS